MRQLKSSGDTPSNMEYMKFVGSMNIIEQGPDRENGLRGDTFIIKGIDFEGNGEVELPIKGIYSLAGLEEGGSLQDGNINISFTQEDAENIYAYLQRQRYGDAVASELDGEEVLDFMTLCYNCHHSLLDCTCFDFDKVENQTLLEEPCAEILVNIDPIKCFVPYMRDVDNVHHKVRVDEKDYDKITPDHFIEHDEQILLHLEKEGIALILPLEMVDNSIVESYVNDNGMHVVSIRILYDVTGHILPITYRLNPGEYKNVVLYGFLIVEKFL